MQHMCIFSASIVSPSEKFMADNNVNGKYEASYWCGSKDEKKRKRCEYRNIRVEITLIGLRLSDETLQCKTTNEEIS